MHPEFNSLPDATGLELVDPIETRRFVMRTDESVAPTDASTAMFAFPVAVARRISTARLTFPSAIPLDVRTPDGDHQASLSPPATREFEPADYLVELHAPLKVYLRVESGMRIDATTDGVTVTFDGTVPVTVGARSYHSSPGATITVPDDPAALMTAVSAFPSAIKTTSPERTWPTMRGHPPRIELGDELHIPDEVRPPDSEVTIRVPATYAAVYPVAPLAYYLDAEVVPGTPARVTTESGCTHSLGETPSEIADEAAHLLKRLFVLDCVTRTEGYYPVELREREVVEARTDLDIPALYDASLAERLEAYLSVPDALVDDLLPRWHRVTYTRPTADAAELLPYVVNDLSLLRVEGAAGAADGRADGSVKQADGSVERADGSVERADGSVERADGAVGRADGSAEAGQLTDDALHSFVRRATSDAEFVRSTADGTRSSDRDAANSESVPEVPARGIPGLGEYVSLPEGGALERAWMGDGTPVHGAKLHPAAFAHETPEPTDGVINVTVVCNDEGMREEWDAVTEIYGGRDDLRVDVTCRFGVSVAELRDLFASDVHVLHYIGHIDGCGFDCADGVLDATTLDSVGATTVLLNGCRSHDQGVAVIEAGANAAVASLGDVGNAGAVEVGETVARLLHCGFSVGSAMTIVEEYTSIGRDYVVVGDPGVTVAQNEGMVPTMYRLDEQACESSDEESVTIESYGYPTQSANIGSIGQPHLPNVKTYRLAVGAIGAYTTSRETFEEVFCDHTVPFFVDGELVWSETLFQN